MFQKHSDTMRLDSQQLGWPGPRSRSGDRVISQSEFTPCAAVVAVNGRATGLTLSWLLNHHIHTHCRRFSAVQ